MKKTTTTTAAVVSGDGIVTKSEGDDFDFDFDRWQAGGITSFSQTCFSEYWSTLPIIINTGNVDDDVPTTRML